MAKSWPPKDPQEVLDYYFDFAPRLPAGDQITSVTATPVVSPDDPTVDVRPGVIVKDSTAKWTIEGSDRIYQGQQVWLSGGTNNTDYYILLHAVSQGGRTVEQTMKIKVKAK